MISLSLGFKPLGLAMRIEGGLDWHCGPENLDMGIWKSHCSRLFDLDYWLGTLGGVSMSQTSFDDIKDAIAQPKHEPVGTNLSVAEAPEPFVAPMFDRDFEEEGELGEVVLIRASAAVGKSTIAKALSAARRIPILDLARVAVATGSLKGILGDLRNGNSPVDAFHKGDLPIIVDALDEGRLLSSEKGFFSFLETSAETILESRDVRNKPKLIMLGRPDAVGYAALAFANDEITVSVLDVGYFDQAGARQLIHAYATQAAAPDSTYFVHSEPVERYITTYFDRIEDALSIEPSQLWESETGRSFAGYAPVLAAIGSLLPGIENFADALNRLNATGAVDAWSVIETVLDEIIARDQRKFIALAESGMSNPLPAEAYDKEEQLTLLLQYIQRESLTGSGRVQLSPNDVAKYEGEVSRWIQEHPFLRREDLSNDVIASFVFASAIAADRSVSLTDRLLALSRQPFLRRSLTGRLNRHSLIDGKYLGYILNSFWNDPLTENDTVSVRTLDDGGAAVIMKCGSLVTEFSVTSPIVVHGQLRNSDFRLRYGLSLEGLGEGASRSFLLDNTVIQSESPVKLDAGKLTIANNVWLDAEVALTSAPISLEFAADAAYFWGSGVSEKYPFNRHASTLDKLEEPYGETLERLLADCASRFGTGIKPILHADYSPPERDRYMQWANVYHDEFPLLMRLIVKHGFADTKEIDASGKGKVRINFLESMNDIKDGVLSGAEPYAGLAADLKAEIK